MTSALRVSRSTSPLHLRSRGLAWLALLALFGPLRAWSAPATELSELSLEDLMDLETDVATRVPLAEREVPGVVTVFDRDEILRSGARDLLELLQRVPGLHADVDVQGVLGLHARGRVSSEGRVLLLLDGQILTEPMYGTSPLGGRFALDHIQRVEVIRGPASARYGGGASAAVVNVVSMSAEGPDGVRAHTQACLRPRGLGCAGAGGSMVFRSGDDVRIGLDVQGADSTLTSGTYTDFYGGSFDAHRANRNRQLQINANMDLAGLHIAAGVEHFARRQQDSYDTVTPEPVRNDFDTAWLRAWTNRQIGQRWVVTPALNLSFYRPWYTGGEHDIEDPNFYDRQVGRIEGSVGALGQLGKGLQLDLGAGGFVDQLRSGPQWKDWPMPQGGRTAVYGSAFARAELMWVGERMNLLAGLRAEYQAPLGPRVVPRLAITTASDRAHLKLLVAGAMRAPTYEQLFPGLDPDRDLDLVAPEASVTAEIEGGVRPADGLELRGNAFAVRTHNPILADWNEIDWDFYYNGAPSTSAGAEGEVQWRTSRVDVRTSYAFSTPVGPQPDTYALDTRGNRVVAMPRHSGTVQGSLSPNGSLWVIPVARVLGPRTVFVGVDDQDELVEGDLPTAVLLDLTLRLENIGESGLDVELGAHDLLNQDPGWHQPFDGYHARLPGRGREVRLKVSYRR